MATISAAAQSESTKAELSRRETGLDTTPSPRKPKPFTERVTGEVEWMLETFFKTTAANAERWAPAAGKNRPALEQLAKAVKAATGALKPALDALTDLKDDGFVEPEPATPAELAPGSRVWLKPAALAPFLEVYSATQLEALYAEKVVGARVLVRMGEKPMGAKLDRSLGFIARNQLSLTAA